MRKSQDKVNPDTKVRTFAYLDEMEEFLSYSGNVVEPKLTLLT